MKFSFNFSHLLCEILVLFVIYFHTVTGDGVQYCLSPDNLGLISECDSSGVQSVKSTENLMGKEDNYWWTDTNSTFLFEVYLKKISNVFVNVFDHIFDQFVQQLSTLAFPVLYGFSMVLFSWLLVYFDSKIPGVYPPTPVSPKKHRIKSGHTFHLGYTIGLVNGIIVFGLTLWQQVFY